MEKGERTSGAGAINLGGMEGKDAKIFHFCQHSELENCR